MRARQDALLQEFQALHAAQLPRANLMDFVQDAKGHYNLCHFWSNFELGDLRFFRSKAYSEFFNFLDRWACTSKSPASGRHAISAQAHIIVRCSCTQAAHALQTTLLQRQRCLSLPRYLSQWCPALLHIRSQVIADVSMRALSCEGVAFHW